MTDSEFMTAAEALLARIEKGCDRVNDETDLDIDNQRVGNMVTLVFASRAQMVINLQKPLHEVWMAAPAGGYHYRWVDGQWRDTKSGSEFFTDVSDHASRLAGVALQF